MSKWEHAICEVCWRARQGAREPVRVVKASIETCCYCGEATRSGIYVRADPAEVVCKGIHPQPAGE
jgi:ribosome-binding protein aMBF1 (putative translation factor)